MIKVYEVCILLRARVRDCYLSIAAAEPQRVRVIDAARSVEEVHAGVLAVVLPFLEGKGER